ncbi:MAG: hypothetical protein M1290_04505 [Candidatus Thermoplasmatota archaeon]|jgi:hypothetical protein|nr:hypothetical protein [Candidatus Thermoplasmatota archaeon]
MNYVLLILLWLHVFFVVLWLGGFLFQVIVIFPALSSLSPQGRMELFQNVIGRGEKVFLPIMGLTLVFGFILLVAMFGLNLRVLLTSRPWIYLISGGSLGLIASLKFIFIDRPGIVALTSGKGGDAAFSGSRRPSPSMIILLVVQLLLLMGAFTLMIIGANL